MYGMRIPYPMPHANNPKLPSGAKGFVIYVQPRGHLDRQREGDSEEARNEDLSRIELAQSSFSSGMCQFESKEASGPGENCTRSSRTFIISVQLKRNCSNA